MQTQGVCEGGLDGEETRGREDSRVGGRERSISLVDKDRKVSEIVSIKENSSPESCRVFVVVIIQVVFTVKRRELQLAGTGGDEDGRKVLIDARMLVNKRVDP